MAALEAVLRHDRAVTAIGLFATVALAWAYLFDMALVMPNMSGVTGRAVAWSSADFGATFIMWAVMMVAMMLPGAAPMILLFATLGRRKRETGSASVPTTVFALGYLIAWTAFSLAATVLQWQLHELALLSPTMTGTSAVLGGVLFIAAAAYQWTPWKNACLRHCRSPFDFVLNHWRDGWGGALRMGLEHGGFCVGCCWLLMGLLFVGGVMNLLWVAAVAIFVMLEKLMPGGPWIRNAGGAAMALGGLVLLYRGLA